jgi:hypothetical protein
MKKLIGVAAVAALVTGCAGNAQQDYYLAMAQAAQAQADTQQMRYAALATMAQGGDETSKTAAVMAIALSRDEVVAPRYIESDALKWASVIAPVASTLTLGVVAADVAKHSSDNSTLTTINSQDNNTAVSLGNQGLIGGITSNTAGYDAISGVASQSIDTLGGITETAITQAPWAVTVVDPVVVEPVIVDPVIVEPVIIEAGGPTL